MIWLTMILFLIKMNSDILNFLNELIIYLFLIFFLILIVIVIYRNCDNFTLNGIVKNNKFTGFFVYLLEFNGFFVKFKINLNSKKI